MASAFLPGFGPLLKQFRRAARLTQAQLAERAGFSVVYISMLERGARQPQPSTVALLADALDLSERRARRVGVSRRRRPASRDAGAIATRRRIPASPGRRLPGRAAGGSAGRTRARTRRG